MAEPDDPEVAAKLLRATDGSRDVGVLGMLAQHHYLTTGQVASLFFTYRRGAQRRMARLERWGLVTRWHRMEPRLGGWRKHDDLFLLTPSGASVIARYLRTDAKPIIRRAFTAFHYAMHIDHDLGVASFFAELAASSRDLPAGLYGWLGDDGVRRLFQTEAVDAAPDGFGRYLLLSREIAFYLEWDRGTEGPQRIKEKAAALAGANVPSAHVLWVAQTAAKERTVRSAISRAGGRGSSWTTNTGQLDEHGPLGPVWQGMDSTGNRHRLTDLPSEPRSDRRIEDCLGKPGWWQRRPGGGEGA